MNAGLGWMLGWVGCWDGIDAVIEWIGMDAGLGCDGCLAGMDVGMDAGLGWNGCWAGMEKRMLTPPLRRCVAIGFPSFDMGPCMVWHWHTEARVRTRPFASCCTRL